MKKFFLPLMLMIFFMTGCGTPDKVDKIIVGLDDEFAPMGFRNKHGEIVGFDVDLAKEAARRLDYEIEFKPIDWNNKEAELEEGNIDVIWNGLNITPERQETMLFSKPYMNNRQFLLVKKGSNLSFTSEYDLKDKIVGTQAGSTAGDYLDTQEELKNSFREFKAYDTYLNAFNALDDGKIEVLIVDEIAGRYEMILQPGKFESREVTIGPITEVAIGFKKDNTELRDKIQTVFDGMIKDGTARKISEEWFQADLITYQR